MLINSTLIPVDSPSLMTLNLLVRVCRNNSLQYVERLRIQNYHFDIILHIFRSGSVILTHLY